MFERVHLGQMCIISSDLTPKERSQNKVLRDELKLWRFTSEKNIYVCISDKERL